LFLLCSHLSTGCWHPDREAYERKIVERFSRQNEFQFVIPPPMRLDDADIGANSNNNDEAAN
jgi:hypothetical protein